MEEETEHILEQARQWSTRPAPLAPYWEGRTFEDALETSIRDLHSESERAALYERLFALIDRNDPMVQDQALSCLYEAFRAENWEDEADQPEGRSGLPIRLEGILAAVEQRLAGSSDLLEQFCGHFHPNLFDICSTNRPIIEQILNWLSRLEAYGDACPVLSTDLLAVRILYGAYGTLWREAGDRLIAALDHEDLNVRACASYQIGKFCRRLALEDPDQDDWDRNLEADRRATEGMAPLEDYWDLIRSKEIQRPGVAGAFWARAPTWTIDAGEWVLTLLEQAEPEPYLFYFPCNLGFDAHERFSRNPAAIRRLMDAGRIEVAIAAAAEENEPIEGMEPLLMELGVSDDAEVVHLASWTLAYHYNRVHPNGERLGFVQGYSGRADCDMVLLYSKRHEPAIPYAVMLYPKPPFQHWTREEAKALVDRVFPHSARGEERRDDLPRQSTTLYRRGYVQYTAAGKGHPVRSVGTITIGYRSSVYWNPVDS